MKFFAATFVALIAVSANAETIYLSSKPSSTITTDQAATAKDGAYQCQLVMRGPNINPVKVPGSETLWSSSPGKAVAEVGPLFANGKQAYRCKKMKLDNVSGRMKAFN